MSAGYIYLFNGMMDNKHSSPPFRWSFLPIAALYLSWWGLFFWMFPALADLATDLRHLVLLLLRYSLIALTLLLERGHWDAFFLTRHNLRDSLRDGLWLTLAFIPFGWLHARYLLGGVSWLPVRDWPLVLLTALLTAALPEELGYRAFLLGVFRRWNIPSSWAILIVGLLFGPLHHNRYIWQGNFLALGIVTAFGFLAAGMTLKRRNVAGAILAHTSMNFIFFLFIGGTLTTL